MLVRVLYVSEISEGVSSTDIDRLVANARRRNRQLDLTGALLVCEGRFAQAIEGQELLVEEVIRKIALDPRHHHMTIHERSTIKLRRFSDWSMALVRDPRCDADFRAMVTGEFSPEVFMMAMADWIEESRSAPQ